MWQVGIAGLVCCGKVFAWWVGVVVGLACHGRACVQCVGAMARFLWGGLVLKSGMHAMLGWHWSSVMASLACYDRVVAVDLCMANGGGGGHSLHAARRQGLARLEGWSEKERKKEKK